MKSPARVMLMHADERRVRHDLYGHRSGDVMLVGPGRSFVFQYVECSIPAGMTFSQWIAAGRPTTRSAA